MLRRREGCENMEDVMKVSGEGLQLGSCSKVRETYSATAGALREIVLASTTKAIALAFERCSTNCPLNLGCPGTSITRNVFLGDNETFDTFICIDVCVGSI